VRARISFSVRTCCSHTFLPDKCMHACIAPAQIHCIHTDKHAPLSAAFVILNRPLAI
jgi:hypothetical protein